MPKEMKLIGVRVQMPTNTPILLLREADGERRVVPIFIGGPEAHAIDMAISGAEVSRPLTHDLFASVLEGLDVTLEQVVVTDLKEGTFFAELYLRDAAGEVITLSSRPSDAIALAARTGSPILAEENLIEEAGVVDFEDDSGGDEEEMVEELRKFLDEVKPEDFLPNPPEGDN